MTEDGLGGGESSPETEQQVGTEGSKPIGVVLDGMNRDE